MLPALNLLRDGLFGKPEPVYALVGEDAFLRGRVRDTLLHAALGAERGGLVSCNGEDVDWPTLEQHLFTRPLFGGRAAAVVEAADPFVTASRSALEKYVASPGPGFLILELIALHSNSKLAKVLGESAIECEVPSKTKLPEFCVMAARTHEAQLPLAVASALIDLANTMDTSILMQEIAKLAAYVGKGGVITEKDVLALVGDATASDAAEIAKRIIAGDGPGALGEVDKLFAKLGPSRSERSKAAAGVVERLTQRFLPLARTTSLYKPGMTPVAIKDSLIANGAAAYGIEDLFKMLVRLGPKMCRKLTSWFIHAIQDLKGGSSLLPQCVVETLVLRLTPAVKK